MDYIKRVAAAVEYIEANLGDPIGLADAARVACFSPFHFHRIFRAFVGDSVSDYIRKRRLTEAARELLTTKKKIIDIALDNLFESQESFTRAFQKAYKTTPGRFRHEGRRYVFFDKNKVTMGVLRHLQKGVTMIPKIIYLPEFKVVGLRKKVTLKTSGTIIPKQWGEFLPRMSEIKNRVNFDVSYGLCEYKDLADFEEDTPYSELVCVEVKNFDRIPDGMVKKVIPASRYAVFTHKGPTDRILATYDYIYKTWLPKSGYELAPQDDFELYDRRFRGVDNPESEIDIYIPIK
jgi:AraC family transcriptional regulator